MGEISLKSQIQEAMKAAMRAKDKDRLGTIRLMTAAMKQKEVDERIELSDEHVLTILDKMVKQRRDAIAQYQDAKRDDLAEKESAEMTIIQEFMPEALGEDELKTLIESAISETGAQSMKDMGRVMGILKPQIQGRADMSVVSGLIKTQLSG